MHDKLIIIVLFTEGVRFVFAYCYFRGIISGISLIMSSPPRCSLNLSILLRNDIGFLPMDSHHIMQQSFAPSIQEIQNPWWRHQLKHFPHYRSFMRGIHRRPVNSQHKGQWRGALMISLTCAWINGWVNTAEAGDLRHHRAHYDVTVMLWKQAKCTTAVGKPLSNCIQWLFIPDTDSIGENSDTWLWSFESVNVP